MPGWRSAGFSSTALDLSYWGKRRLRLIPEWNQREQRCTPDRDLV